MPDRVPEVLVVEGQPDLRALLQTVLRHHGFRVLLAQNRTDALPMFRTYADEIDVVLLNESMLDWPGESALREIRDVRPDAVVCFMAGETRNGHPAPDLVALGAAKIVRKPFEPSELAQNIWGLIRPRDRRGEPRRSPQTTKVRVGPGLMPEYVVESWIGDESLSGLCLRLPERIGEVGSILSICPADAPADAPWIPVQVRHMRREAEQWTVGCQFLHPAARR